MREPVNWIKTNLQPAPTFEELRSVFMLNIFTLQNLHVLIYSIKEKILVGLSLSTNC